MATLSTDTMAGTVDDYRRLTPILRSYRSAARVVADSIAVIGSEAANALDVDLPERTNAESFSKPINIGRFPRAARRLIDALLDAVDAAP